MRLLFIGEAACQSNLAVRLSEMRFGARGYLHVRRHLCAVSVLVASQRAGTCSWVWRGAPSNLPSLLW